MTDWNLVRMYLGIPHDWTLRSQLRGGRWVLRATGGEPLPCGHRSMQVTADDLPMAVARMVHTIDFHRSEGRPG